MNTLEALYKEELDNTRFLGMGNPAESGTHLLYYFRQENRLSRDYFISEHQILDQSVRSHNVNFREPNLKRLVFIDDVCGSGQQSVEYSRTLLDDLKHVASRHKKEIQFEYLVLFGTRDGLSRAKKYSSFDRVAAVHEIDEEYKAFHERSRVYKSTDGPIDRESAKRIFRTYGQKLYPSYPLGYGDGQLLLAFTYNIPDNCLPAIWFDEDPAAWKPILPRYPKVVL